MFPVYPPRRTASPQTDNGCPPRDPRCEREIRPSLHRRCGAISASGGSRWESRRTPGRYASGAASGSTPAAAPSSTSTSGSASARLVRLPRRPPRPRRRRRSRLPRPRRPRPGRSRRARLRRRLDGLPVALVDLRAGRAGGRCRLGRGCRLGGLHRGELLLGRQLAALGHDHQLDLGRDALEDVDRHRVAADPLDVVDADLAAVDADLADPPDLVGDVGRRDRAEQRSGRAGLDVEPEHELAERVRDLRGLLGAARLVHRLLGVDAPDLLDPSLRRDLGEVARQQEVAGVPAGDVDDLATQAELLHVLEQDHVHQALLARDVGQERDLAGPLDRDGDLPLVAAARAGDAAVADLALLGDVAP